MRPLSLHLSALNDHEYDLYTSSFNDLAELPDSGHGPRSIVQKSTRYEDTRVGVREARAWLRGRYSNLSSIDIDMILKLFCPNMLSSDFLSGDQFFAVLRLVLHVQDGKPVDRNLAFVQTYPKPSKPIQSSPPSPPKPQLPARAPPPPARAPPPPLHPTHPDTNPFSRKSMDRIRSPPPTPDLLPTVAPALPPKISHNPFLQQDKVGSVNDDSSHPPVIPPLPPRKPAMPLPPRRTTAPPAVHQTGIPSSAPPTIKEKGPPPSVPLKPSRMTSPLMQQSLEASRHAQNVKRAEELRNNERVMQVIRTSGSPAPSTTSRASRSASPVRPPPPPPLGAKGRRTSEFRQKQGSSISASEGTSGSSSLAKKPLVQKPRASKVKPKVNPHPTFSDTDSSESESEASFYEVAGATLTRSAPSTTSPTRTPTPVPDPFRPPLPSRDSTSTFASASTSFAAPPTHPDRRPSDTVETLPSPTTRVFRSRSLHSPNSTPPIPPPRKRPESAQINTPIHKSSIASLGHAHTRTTSYQGVSRHLSLSSHPHTSASTSTAGGTAAGEFGEGISNIQRTLAQLQMKAQPKFDAARYKAEAGLSRRGFVGGGGRGLGMQGDEGTQGLMGDDRSRDRDQSWDRRRNGFGTGTASGLVANDDAGVDMGGPGPASISITDSDSELDDVGRDHRGRRNLGEFEGREYLYERDNLKWPAGDGWKPLS